MAIPKIAAPAVPKDPTAKVSQEKVDAVNDGITILKQQCDVIYAGRKLDLGDPGCDPEPGLAEVSRSMPVIVRSTYEGGVLTGATVESSRWKSKTYQVGTVGWYDEFQALSFKDYVANMPPIPVLSMLVQTYNAGFYHGMHCFRS